MCSSQAIVYVKCQADFTAMASTTQSTSNKLQMTNPHLKRASLLLTIVTIYFVGFKDVKILSKLPLDFAEVKEEKRLRDQPPKPSKDTKSITSTEPYNNRWQRRFTNNTQGYFFFKHIRKAGGTSLRSYFRDVFNFHKIKHITRDAYHKIKEGEASPEVLYVEHEFQTMDADCATVDARWEKSLSVITLRVSVYCTVLSR